MVAASQALSMKLANISPSPNAPPAPSGQAAADEPTPEG